MAENKEKRYVSDNAQLMSEWDWEKNNELGFEPNSMTLGSNKKAWWKCDKGHEWQAVIAHRAKGVGCPYCSNRKVLHGYNDLATTHPKLASEWHPSRNGNIKPTDVTYGTGTVVWWKCSLGHEWKTSPNKRTSDETGCPFCSGKKVLPGFNDLSTTHPRLSEEWHPTLNGNLTPKTVTFGSSKSVWWKCHKGHEWRASISNRSKNRNCPICSRHTKTSFPEQAVFYYLKKHFPFVENRNVSEIGMELDIFIPSIKTAIEYDGVYYHKANGTEQRKNLLCRQHDIRLIRIREKGLKVYNDCECVIVDKPSNLQSINQALKKVFELLGIKNIDIDLINETSEILDSYLLSENEKSLQYSNPKLASEWHPTKNGNLQPTHLAANSVRIVWWKCQKGHEWQASIHNRAKGTGCPYCSGRLAVSGESDLLSLYPRIVDEWNYDLNGQIEPDKVKPGSNIKVWWNCSVCGHNWKTSVRNRVAGCGCPVCAAKNKTRRGFEKRKSHNVFVEELKRINSNIKLISTYVVSTKKVKCFCLICQNEWEALPDNLLKGKGCPYCSGRSVVLGKNDLLTKFPNIAEEWDFEKNDPLLPSEVKYGSNKIVWWKCKTCGYSWQMSITNRTIGCGCPSCRNERIGARLRKSHETFVDEMKRINPSIELVSKYITAKQKVSCKCLVCENTWEALPSNLLKGCGCPRCAKRKKQ